MIFGVNTFFMALLAEVLDVLFEKCAKFKG